VRALYVNHTSRISGGELSLLSLLKALPSSMQATVACPEGPLAHRLRGQGVDVALIRGTDGSLRLHPTRTARALMEMGRAAMQVRKVAAATRADLIHANSIRAGIIATGAASASGRPTIVHVRDCLPSGRASALSLRVIGRADALIANSAYTRSTLGPGRDAAHVVHNAVDLARFEQVHLTPAEARLRLGLCKSRPVLAVIAQITPWKGQDDAIRIAADLIDVHPELQLLLVGSPKFTSDATRYDNTAYFESLRRQIIELGLTGSVHVLGEREDVPEILRATDLLLVPSWEEPFGRTIIEAMASGVPVVATNVGGPPEILDEGPCGLVLPPRQPQVWAKEIERLLSDPVRLNTMCKRGQDAARRRFCMERHVSEVLEVYESVLGVTAAVPA